MSVLILMGSTFFLSVLSCHKEDKKWAVAHVRGKLRSSVESKFRVMTWELVMLGMSFLKPWRRILPDALLSLQSNMASITHSIQNRQTI